MSPDSCQTWELLFAFSPASSHDCYRCIYFEDIDFMVNAIDQRFSQPSFYYISNNGVFFEVVISEDCSTELKFLETNYADDLVSGRLKAQLEIFKF